MKHVPFANASVIACGSGWTQQDIIKFFNIGFRAKIGFMVSNDNGPFNLLLADDL